MKDPARRRSSAAVWVAGALALLHLRCYWLAPYSDLTSGIGQDGGDPGDARSADAAADTGPETSETSGGGHFCERVSPPPSFCRDFDEGEAAGAGFTFVNASPGGTLAVDPNVGAASSASLHAAVPATAGGGPLEYLAQDFDVTTELHVAFDARADELGNATDEVTLVSLNSHDTALNVGRSLLYYTTRAGAPIEEESGPPFMNWPKALPGPPATGQWLHYDLDVRLTPQRPSILTLIVDRTTWIDHQPLGQEWRPGTFRLSIGLAWISQSRAAWSFHYDNVVVVAR